MDHKRNKTFIPLIRQFECQGNYFLFHFSLSTVVAFV